MTRVDIKSITINSIKRELRRLKHKYKLLDVNQFKIEQNKYSYGMSAEYFVCWKGSFFKVWAQGDPISTIENNILFLSMETDKILGFYTQICCKLVKK